jgi:hypothetical protein
MSEFMNEGFLEGVQSEPIVAEGSFFFKPEVGSTTIRLMTKPFQFYTVWGLRDGERVKHAHRTIVGLKEFETAEDKVKMTWGLVVWNYAEGKLMAWELTQKTIINQFITLANAGTSMMDRDLTIIRTGEKLLTKYQVVPAAPGQTEAGVIEAMADSVINLDGFVDGTDILAPREV